MSREREGADCPLVIGGGPVTANPEPYADFFDAFVIGDGEDVIKLIIEKVRKRKKEGLDKKELLLELAKIKGVYVPSFYKPGYSEDGTLLSFKALEPQVPETIEKQSVDIEKAFYPYSQIVPYVETVHNRLNVEVARGCPQSCRFCQATRYYGPYRARSFDNVMGIIEKGLKSTGFDSVSLSSLSCTQYNNLEKVLLKIKELYADSRISVSLPSLRCDRFSIKLACNLNTGKRANLTFAPEAGSERLRGAIGKNLTDDQIINTVELAFKLNWKLVKLYFMIGLPSEKEEDIDAINTLVRTIKNRTKRLNFHVTVSSFVPKAGTPFQWAAMQGKDELLRKLKKLMKMLPASVKHSSVENALLEGVFARGDRRLSKVIIRALEKGCKFDQWREKLKFNLWEEAFKEEGLDMGFYVSRERPCSELLPWQHIVLSKREDLWEAYRKSRDANTALRSEEKTGAEIVNNSPALRAFQDKPVQRVRLRLKRSGNMRFISHLDQIELVRKAVRRSGIKLAYTSGFHPQPRISFGPAVSVGHESECEYVEIALKGRMDPDKLAKDISCQLPRGYEIMEAKRTPVFFPSVDALLNLVEYAIDINVEQAAIDSFLSRQELVVEKTKKGKISRIDVKPLIKGIKNDGGRLYIQLRFGPNKTVKPEKIIQLLAGFSDEQAKLLRITRKNLLIEKEDGTACAP
jgi:radical SAM family uncharacterized protein/radical SAM-linked protein